MFKVFKAIIWSSIYHFGQFRKNSKIPYVVHPIRVMIILWKHGVRDYDVLTAAVLHDVLEDCDVNHRRFYKRFGSWIYYVVKECSNRYIHNRYPNKTRAWRKAMEVKRIGDCSEEVQSIKVADAIDNLKSITKIDREFTKIYYKEKKELIMWCRRVDDKLIESLHQQLEKTYEEITCEK